MEENKQIILGFGIAPEDIGLIAGTEEGLRNLIQACEAALEQNANDDIDLGRIEGVKKVEQSYFTPNIPTSSKFEKIYLKFFAGIFEPVISVVFIAAILIGFYTIFQWLF